MFGILEIFAFYFSSYENDYRTYHGKMYVGPAIYHITKVSLFLSHSIIFTPVTKLYQDRKLSQNAQNFSSHCQVKKY